MLEIEVSVVTATPFETSPATTPDSLARLEDAPDTGTADVGTDICALSKAAAFDAASVSTWALACTEDSEVDVDGKLDVVGLAVSLAMLFNCLGCELAFFDCDATRG
jgi:hypothetical protein